MIRSSTVKLTFGFLVAAKSTAMGQSVEVARGTVQDKPIQPQVAIGLLGTIHDAFGRRGHVCYSHSYDGGKTFTEAKEISGEMEIATGMRRGP